MWGKDGGGGARGVVVVVVVGNVPLDIPATESELPQCFLTHMRPRIHFENGTVHKKPMASLIKYKQDSCM